MTFCSDCGKQLEDEEGHERAPCPDCGSTSRKFAMTVGGSITPFGRVMAVKNRSVAVGTATERDIAMPITPVKGPQPEYDLPTEVVADSLHVGLTLLEPDDKGQWVMGIQGFGKLGFAAVGKLADVLTEGMAWMEELAKEWLKKISGDDDAAEAPKD